MLTVNEIENKKFSKALIGGYDTEEVNEFLNKIADDYDSLVNEVDTLKGKLKLLVDKLEEYRDIEDSLRKALFTAEKTADKVKEEARHRCESMLKDTQLAIEKEKREAHRQLRAELVRLQEAKNQTASFIKMCINSYNKQINLLTSIPNLHIEIDENTDQAVFLSVEEANLDKTVKEISENIIKEDLTSAKKDNKQFKSKISEEIVLKEPAKEDNKEERKDETVKETEKFNENNNINEPIVETEKQFDENIIETKLVVESDETKKLEKAEEKNEDLNKNNDIEKKEDIAPKRKGLEVKVIELNIKKPSQPIQKTYEQSNLFPEDESTKEEESTNNKFEDLKFGKNYKIKKRRQ